MSPESFDDLYKLVRGSQCANLVVDARNLIAEQDYAESFDRIIDARASYAEQYSRILKHSLPDAPLEPPKKIQKREKVHQAMTAFDLIISRLERWLERQPPPDSNTNQQSSAEGDPAKCSSEDQAEPQGDLVLSEEVMNKLTAKFQEFKEVNRAWIEELLTFHSIENASDFKPNASYFIQTASTSVLVKITEITSLAAETDPLLRLNNLLDDRPIKAVPLQGLLKLARESRCFRLGDQDASTKVDAPKPVLSKDRSTEPIEPLSVAKEQPSTEETEQSGEGQKEKKSDHQNILDLGAFSQLLTSAQRSGLVPNADQIGYVRDKEFRQGKYDKAFQSIDMMHNRFLANAGQRQARLSREDVDIAAGRIKISPRELQAKRSRDRLQTQEVDRAKRRFQVVLEGLRILMNHEQAE